MVLGATWGPGYGETPKATAAGGLYIATHRGVQLGIGLASDAVRHYGGAHG